MPLISHIRKHGLRAGRKSMHLVEKLDVHVPKVFLSSTLRASNSQLFEEDGNQREEHVTNDVHVSLQKNVVLLHKARSQPVLNRPR